MKDQIQQIFDAGLSLSLADGGLKVSGAPELIDEHRALLKQCRAEIIKRLQADSATEKAPAMFALVGEETNAAAGTGQQSRHALPCSENDKKILADAVALIGRLEHTRPEIAEEMIKAFNTVGVAELAGDLSGFNFALSILKETLNDFQIIPNAGKTDPCINSKLCHDRKTTTAVGHAL